MRNSLLALVLLASACSSTSTPATATASCQALATCCTSLPAVSQADCLVVAEGEDATTCSATLDTYEGAGACGSVVSSGSSSRITIGFSSVTNGSSGGSGCSALAVCCAAMTGTSLVTCDTIASSGDAATCNAELETYSAAGLCSAAGSSGPATSSGGTTSSVTTTSTSSFPNSSGSTSVTSSSVATGAPVPAPGSVAIATSGSNPNAIFAVIGLTTDNYILYFDATGGISASDIDGNVTEVAPGPKTDGGLGPYALGLGGNVLAILTDYTTTTTDGVVVPVSGALSIWSHTQTAGKLVQVATDATAVISIPTSSSYVVYADGADSTGMKGNIGVVAGNGTGAIDVVKNVVIDTTTTTTCAPWAVVDEGYLVTSTCALTDGGNASPQIAIFSGTPWAQHTVLPNAGPSTPYVSPYSVNFVTDTSGDNLLAVTGSGPGLTSWHLTGVGSTSLATSFGAPSGGTEFFYLTPQSTFALFLSSAGALEKATYATPTSAPTVAQLNAGPILGVQVVSPDQAYEVDYNTALDATVGTPSELSLRSTSTGSAVTLVSNALSSTFGGQNGFTADSSYVVWTSDLVAVGAEASTGTLYSAPVATGTPNAIVTNTTVWNASPLTGKNLIYSQNYVASPYSTLPNGAASADVYVVSATGTGPGTLVVAAADAPDAFYVTSDKSHLFYSFTQIDSSSGAYPTDGIYCVALPPP